MQPVGMADTGFINQETSGFQLAQGVTLFPAYNSPCSYKVSSLTDTTRVRARVRAGKNCRPPGTGYHRRRAGLLRSPEPVSGGRFVLIWTLFLVFPSTPK